MKKIIGSISIFLSLIAAFLTFSSNTEFGRNLYRKSLCKQLNNGINKLFQEPNKYRDHKIEQRYVGKWNYFYLQKEKDAEFKKMKDFILDNYYTRDLGYEIKVIVQYQMQHIGTDAMNPDFNIRPIFFVKETENNKDIDFKDASDEMMKEAIPITSQNILTQNLDTYFSNRIRTIVLILVIGVAILNSAALFLKENIS